MRMYKRSVTGRRSGLVLSSARTEQYIGNSLPAFEVEWSIGKSSVQLNLLHLPIEHCFFAWFRVRKKSITQNLQY